jgi:hypothetical protein
VGAKQVADAICTYFGGAYNATTHTYATPQITVAKLGGPIFRRGTPKRDDHATDYGLTQPGIPAGCLAMVLISHGEEQRAAHAGATSGLKLVKWSVQIHFFIRSESSYTEELQDTLYDLLDAVRARIEADRTCGTGGFEAGYGVGFQVGEGGAPWLKWHVAPVDASFKELSKGYLLVEFDADQYIQA